MNDTEIPTMIGMMPPGTEQWDDNSGAAALSYILPAAGELTGVPAMYRGGSRVIEGAQEGDTLKGLGGAAEATLGALPYAGAVGRALMATAPKAAATFGGLIGTAEVAEAQERSKKRAQATQPLPSAAAGAPTNDAMLKAIGDDPALMALYGQLKDRETKAEIKFDGLGAASANEVRAKAASDAATLRQQLMEGIAAKTRANQPLNVAYPNETLTGQLATGAVGIGAGLLLRGKQVRGYNASLSGLEKTAHAAADRSQEFARLGDLIGARAAIKEAQAAKVAAEKLSSSPPGGGIDIKGALPAIGGIEAALLGPQLIDHYLRATPGSQLAERTKPKLDEVLPRMAVGSGLGYAISKVGNTIPAIGLRAPYTGTPAIAGAEARLLGPQAGDDAIRIGIAENDIFARDLSTARQSGAAIDLLEAAKRQSELDLLRSQAPIALQGPEGAAAAEAVRQRIRDGLLQKLPQSRASLPPGVAGELPPPAGYNQSAASPYATESVAEFLTHNSDFRKSLLQLPPDQQAVALATDVQRRAALAGNLNAGTSPTTAEAARTLEILAREQAALPSGMKRQITNPQLRDAMMGRAIGRDPGSLSIALPVAGAAAMAGSAGDEARLNQLAELLRSDLPSNKPMQPDGDRSAILARLLMSRQNGY